MIHSRVAWGLVAALSTGFALTATWQSFDSPGIHGTSRGDDYTASRHGTRCSTVPTTSPVASHPPLAPTSAPD